MAYTPVILGSGNAGFSFLTRTREAQQALFQNSVEIKRETDRFAAEIADVKTADDLVDNYQLLQVALGAFGLEEDINNRGFLREVLNSDPNDGTSFVNRLADKSYLEFAKAFNFGGSGGPDLAELNSVDAIKAEVQALESADDLVGDTALLRAALDTFGLGGDTRNTHFVKLVLNSDISDPTSFANTLSDDRYAAFAESFGFGARQSQKDSIFGIAETFSGQFETLETAEDLLDQPELMQATFKLFGLRADAGDVEFWGNVLNSDVSDENAFANQLEDPRYAAIARAFEFGDPDASVEDESAMQTFVEAVSDRTTPYTDTSDFFSDFKVLLATLDVLDLPRTGRAVPYAGRVLESDLNDPNSLINLEPDPRYAALAEALNFQPVETGHTYPDGFADAIAQRYVNNQFEVQVGQQDSSLRVALAFESSLNSVVENGSSNDSRWFGIMSSNPLRTVFESVFQLPTSFGTLDIDQQLKIFKERSENLYGTPEVSELASPEVQERIRASYLFQSNAQTAGADSGALVLALLQG